MTMSRRVSSLIILFNLLVTLCLHGAWANVAVSSPCAPVAGEVPFYFDPDVFDGGNSINITNALSTCPTCKNAYYYKGNRSPRFRSTYNQLFVPGANPLAVLLTCKNYCCCSDSGVCYFPTVVGETIAGVYPFCDRNGCRAYLHIADVKSSSGASASSTNGQIIGVNSVCHTTTCVFRIHFHNPPLIITSCSCNGCNYNVDCTTTPTTNSVSTPTSCFSADTRVRSGTTGELRRMDELAEGEWVLSRSRERAVFTPVQAWMHRMPEQRATFHQLELEGLDDNEEGREEEGKKKDSQRRIVEEGIKVGRKNEYQAPLGRRLKLTAKHFIYKTQCIREPHHGSNGSITHNRLTTSYEDLARTKAVFAEEVQVGDCLYQLAAMGDELVFVERRVINVTLVEERGIYAPMTANGDIVVEDVLASCHVIFNNHRAQKSYFRIVSGPTRIVNWFIDTMYSLYSDQSPLLAGAEEEKTNTRGQEEEKNGATTNHIDLPFGLVHLVEFIEYYFLSTISG